MAMAMGDDMKRLYATALALRLWLDLRLHALLEWLDPPPPPEDLRPVYRRKHNRVIWTEPGEGGSGVTRSCSIAEAVARQRASGLRHKHHYATDREALEDFLAIYWADAENLDWSKLDE